MRRPAPGWRRPPGRSEARHDAATLCGQAEIAGFPRRLPALALHWLDEARRRVLNPTTFGVALFRRSRRGRGVARVPTAILGSYSAATAGGGSKAVIAGTSPSKSSTSTNAVCALGPWARREVPLSRVRTLGFAVLVEGADLAGRRGIVPGAGREPRDARADLLAQHRAGQYLAAIVEYADDFTPGDPPRLGVGRVQHDRLPPPDLARQTEGTLVQLAVQPGARLAGEHVQGMAVRFAGAQPFGWLQPGGHAGAIVVAEALYGGRVDLDFTRGRLQRARLGVRAEFGEEDVGRLRLRAFRVALAPEGLEIRPGDVAGGGLLAGDLVDMLDPVHLVAALGIGLGEAEPPGQAGEDVEVVPRLAHGLDRLFHGEDEAVAFAATDVVPLHRRGRRQHDVGMARRRRPPGLVHHDGLRPAPGLDQAIEILVVVEGIAAAPVDQADVGVGPRAPVEVVGAARVQQHVGDAGDGDRIADLVLRARQGRRADRAANPAHAGDGAVAEAEAAAGEADLPHHRGERDQHPEGLLAMVAPLQRPAGGEHGARRRHGAGEIADRHRLDAGDGGGPVRVLRHAIGFPRQVGLEALVAVAVALQEGAVRQPLDRQGVGQAQHQRGVGIRPNGQPFGRYRFAHVGADGRDVDETAARGPRPVEVAAEAMLADATRADLIIPHRQAAEGDEEAGLLDDTFPRGDRSGGRRRLANHMRHDREGGGDGIAADLSDIAAVKAHEALQHGLGVMQLAGAGPAVGAGEDRLVAMRLAHPLQLVRHQIQRPIPGDRHVGLRAPAGTRIGSPLQVALADVGAVDPAPVIDRFRHRLQDGRGLGVPGEGLGGDEAAVLHHGVETAPLRQMALARPTVTRCHAFRSRKPRRAAQSSIRRGAARFKVRRGSF